MGILRSHPTARAMSRWILDKIYRLKNSSILAKYAPLRAEALDDEKSERIGGVYFLYIAYIILLSTGLCHAVPVLARQESGGSCENKDKSFSVDQQINGCTALIQRGAQQKIGLAPAYYNRGNAYFAKGYYEQAISDYDKAIELEPNNAIVYFSRGKAYAYNNKFDEAISDYNKAIEINPKFAMAYFYRAQSYSETHEYERASADYGKTIDLEPKFELAYRYSSDLYKNHLEFERRRKELKRQDLSGDYAAKRYAAIARQKSYELWQTTAFALVFFALPLFLSIKLAKPYSLIMRYVFVFSCVTISLYKVVGEVGHGCMLYLYAIITTLSSMAYGGYIGTKMPETKAFQGVPAFFTSLLFIIIMFFVSFFVNGMAASLFPSNCMI
jgi:tetratricopeptide (TPR) repeat protein